jgi:hypothetical protein
MVTASPGLRSHLRFRRTAMRRLAIVVAIIAVGVRPVFGDEKERPTNDKPTIRDIFSKLGKRAVEEATRTSPEDGIRRFERDFNRALSRRDESAFGRLIDSHVLADRILSLQEVGEGEPVALDEVEPLLRFSLPRALLNEPEWLTFTRLEIDDYELQPSKNEAIARCSMYTRDFERLRFRLWLSERGEAWRVNDMEEAILGVRISVAFAMLLPNLNAPADRQVKINGQLLAVKAVRQAVAVEDWSRGLRSASEIDFTLLPNVARAQVYLLKSMCQYRLERHAEALGTLDLLDAAFPGVPGAALMRAAAYNGLGEHERALSWANLFLKQVGDQDVGLLHRGIALSCLERYVEAAEAFRAGLRYNPLSFENLASLAAVLDDDKKPELGEWVAKMKRPERVIVQLCEELALNEDTLALKVVVATYRKLRPDDVQGDYYEALWRYWSDQHDEAAAIIHPAIARVEDEEERLYFVQLYLNIMIDSDKAIEGYRNAPDAREAFRHIANELSVAEDEKTLDRLFKIHAKQDAKDPHLGYQRVARSLRHEDGIAALKQLVPIREHVPADELEHLLQDSIWLAGEQGQSVQALEIWPDKPSAFNSLADSVYHEGNFKELANLIAAFAKDHADSPYVPYATSKLRYGQQKYDEAADFAKQARDAFEEEDRRQQADYWMTDALLQGKRYFKAYELTTDPFECIGLIAEADLDEAGLVAFEKILAKHRLNHSDDVWLDRYEARIAAQRKQWNTAIAAYRRGMRSADEDWIRTSYRYRLVGTMYEARRAIDALNTVRPTTAVFSQLAYRAHSDKDADTLADLIDTYRDRAADDAQFPLWPVRLLMLRGDYKAAFDRLQQLEDRYPLDADGYWQFDIIRFELLLRLKKFDEALPHAKSAWEERRNALRMILLYAQERDSQKTIAWIEKGYGPDFDYLPLRYHDLFTEALQDDKMAEVRTKFGRYLNPDGEE